MKALCQVKLNKNWLTPFLRGLHYNAVVVRNIDSNLLNAECLNPDLRSKMDMEVARLQHHHMVQALQRSGILSVYNLPSDGHPDSVFIEDTAVVIGNTVLITNPGASSRQNETIRVREFFKTNRRLFPNLSNVVDLKAGTLDGGDVLFTGREILVGMSKRSNLEGVMSLQLAFPSYPVFFHDISKLEEVLHLKSFCSMCGETDIAVGGDYGNMFRQWSNKRTFDDSAAALLENDSTFGAVWKSIQQISPQSLYSPVSYNFIQFPEDERDAANCLFINGVLIRRSKTEFPKSDLVFHSKCTTKQIEVRGSELAKVDGALTCCSLLLQ